jgi:hypothetical protein
MLLSTLLVPSALAALAALPAPPRSPKVVGEGGIAGANCFCTGDLDQSGSVDAADLSILLGSWGGFGPGNLDGIWVVDAADLSILLGAWGPCPSAPVNDHCGQSIEIDPGVYSFCTTGADTDGPPLPGSGGCNLLGYTQINQDVWYELTPPADGILTVSTCGTSWDTKLALYGTNVSGVPACPSSGITFANFVGCSDDNGGCGFGSSMQANVSADEPYKLRLGGFNGHSGDGTLTVTFQHEGFDCEHAIDLGDPISVTVEGSNAWTDLGEDPDNCSSGDGHSVWYRLQPACLISGSIVVTTCNPGTDFDTILTVWRIGDHGECAKTFIACNDDSNAFGCQIGGVNRKSRISFQTSPGWYYYVQVTGYQGATGHYELSVDMQSCP